MNEWMNECLYYDIWQTADEITTNAYKMLSLLLAYLFIARVIAARKIFSIKYI